MLHAPHGATMNNVSAKKVGVKISRFTMINLFLVTAALMVIGGGVAYYLSPHFLPSISDSAGHVNIEILKVLPAAIGTVVASLIAATAALINVGLQLESAKKLETHRINAQLKANKDLADHGRKIAEDLEKVKTGYLTELEQTKKVFSLELDRETASGATTEYTENGNRPAAWFPGSGRKNIR
jgi:hypothetical protein